MKVRLTLFVAAAAVLAVLAWSDVAARLTGREPAIAVPLLTGPGAFQMTPKEREDLYSGQLAPQRATLLHEDARKTLLAEPLAPTAIWLIAARQYNASTLPNLMLAEQVTRRELGVQMALFRTAAESGDLAKSLAYLDRGLTIHPEAAPGLLRGVVPLLANPDVRALFIPYARRPWFAVLLHEGTIKAEDSLATAELISEAKLKMDQLKPGLLPAVLAKLIKEGEAYEAGRLAMETGAISEAGLENFAISSETTTAEVKPLTWQFTNSDAVSWKLKDATKVEWTLEAGRSAILADRVTLYLPGSYQLTQSLSGTDPRLLVIWELRCIENGGERRVWSQQVPLQSEAQRSAINVAIPYDCPAQRWTLKGSANDLQTSGTVALEHIDLSAHAH